MHLGQNRFDSFRDQNVVLVLNDLMHESHRALFCSNLRKHWTVACLFQQTSLLWIQHGFCHRNETKSKLSKLKLHYIPRYLKILQDILAPRVGAFGFLFTPRNMPVFSCSYLRFADGSCGQNLREVFAWSMSRRLMPDHTFSGYAEKS